MTEDTSHSIPYLPHTKEERARMLETIGVRSFEELVSHIPKELRAKELTLDCGLSELEVTRELAKLAKKNVPATHTACFLGGGSYQRFVPAVVPSIISRSEFSTAYTPYQPEVSQGSLQAIYEFQTAVCLLTGMEVANASMYDGPTALAEAGLMASRLTNKKKILASGSVNPEYRLVTKTYAKACGLEYIESATTGGVTVATRISEIPDLACVIVQYPNYFGCLEELEEIEKATHKQGALLVMVTEPISLGILKSPSDWKADIVVGDAQSCGNFLSFGGPSAGYMATRTEFVRQLPGRLAGMTVDNKGQRAFTLTLQTREQHIRRARATSNICTNQALNALAMLVYLTALGPKGLEKLATISSQRAHYLASSLAEIKGVEVPFNHPFVNEFVLTTPIAATTLYESLKEKGVLAGIPLSRFYKESEINGLNVENSLLVAVTEMNSKSDLDRYRQVFEELAANFSKMEKKTELTKTGRA